MALLHLLADWARDGGPEVAAVTVDHGLRSEAAAEVALVAGTCAGLGVPHQAMRWDWDGQGNLPDRARRARLSLIAGWAKARGAAAVALGHTADDQAETFLMRLARGSGVDGLAAMAPRRRAEGVDWVRPLLRHGRAELRDHLRRRGARWADDPTNEDPAYGRVKARRCLMALEPLGIDRDTLQDTALRLSEARAALAYWAERAARQTCGIEAGDVVIARRAFGDLPGETRLRLLTHALTWVASAEYRPRQSAVEAAFSAIAQGHRHTIAGCLIAPTKRAIRIAREYQAVRDIVVDTDAVWDNRWRLSGPHDKGLQLRALGAAGLRACPEWRQTRLPRATLLASASVWRGGDLVAAPLAGRADGWRAELARGDDDYFTSLLSH